MRVAAREWIAALLRSGVLALAVVTVVGLALESVRSGSAVHPHWMGSTGLRVGDAALALAFSALVILGPRVPRGLRRGLHLGVGGAVLLLSGRALGAHGIALGEGRLLAVGLAPPVTAVSWVLVGAWTLRAVGAPRGQAADVPSLRLGAVVGVSASGCVLLVAYIASVGATDYRAPADAILVLGARVHVDGSPSGSLRDRTATAVALWREGLAPVIVASGGHGSDAPVSEPAVMARLCRDAGLPEDAVIEDGSGLNTEASIRTVARWARERGWREVLVVSHDYHLARVRLLAAREGLRVRTVPARETSRAHWKAAASARELVAYTAAWLF